MSFTWWLSTSFSFLFGILQINSCNLNYEKTSTEENETTPDNEAQIVLTGADQTQLYYPILEGKRLGLVVNHTSVIGESHLVDSLLAAGFQVKKVFAPEHGFRGTASDGSHIEDQKDARTGLPILSIYGKNKKPTKSQLEGIDLLLFDIQDVGLRCYTYTSTMTYVMEAGAENGIPVLVLDRPNPNGHYFDGPILQRSNQSFVGLHPVPLIHGLTVGEYANMINEEGWLNNDLKANLTVVACKNYSHSSVYELPIAPSPNLPNLRSIYLYPHLVLLEGSTYNLGRGTTKQFQVIGHPDDLNGEYTYTPISRPGAKYPKHQDQLCRGYDLTSLSIEALQNIQELDIDRILNLYQQFPEKDQFFREDNYFRLLAGTDELRKQIEALDKVQTIRESWKNDLINYQRLRSKYLLYPE